MIIKIGKLLRIKKREKKIIETDGEKKTKKQKNRTLKIFKTKLFKILRITSVGYGISSLRSKIWAWVDRFAFRRVKSVLFLKELL